MAISFPHQPRRHGDISRICMLVHQMEGISGGAQWSDDAWVSMLCESCRHHLMPLKLTALLWTVLKIVGLGPTRRR